MRAPELSPRTYLNLLDSTHVAVSSFNGRGLIVNRRLRRLKVHPALILTNDGLAPDTNYWVYVRRFAGREQAVARPYPSIAGWSWNYQGGQQVNSKDHGESLVGMLRTNGDGEFEQSPQKLLVISWSNWWLLHAQATFAEEKTASSASYAAVDTAARVELLSWGYAQLATFSGVARGSVDGVSLDLAIHMDRDATSGGQLLALPTIVLGTREQNVSFSRYLSTTFSAPDALPTDGYHTFDLVAKVTGGSAIFPQGCVLGVGLCG